MDPQATFNTFLADGDRATARAYNDWAAKGGFPARAQAHPATDAWMMGDRFGDVVSIGRDYARVRMDRSGKLRRFPRDLLLPV